MRFVFVAPPRNFTWARLTTEMKLEDLLLSYWWFSPPEQRPYFDAYVRGHFPKGRWVIHKRKDNPGSSSYDGATWDRANIRALYRTTYRDPVHAMWLVAVLNKFNRAGFRLSEVGSKRDNLG